MSPWQRLQTAAPFASSTRTAPRGSLDEAIPPAHLTLVSNHLAPSYVSAGQRASWTRVVESELVESHVFSWSRSRFFKTAGVGVGIVKNLPAPQPCPRQPIARHCLISLWPKNHSLHPPVPLLLLPASNSSSRLTALPASDYDEVLRFLTMFLTTFFFSDYVFLTTFFFLTMFSYFVF